MSRLPLLSPSPHFPEGVIAGTTTRIGGVSLSPYRSFNLATHVGDDPALVLANRQRFQEHFHYDTTPQWLNQTHSTRIAYLDQAKPFIDADAAWSDRSNLLCTVLTADCLPILLARRDARRVAAIHAGWRGVVDGVIEESIEAICNDSQNDSSPSRWLAWLGPCIGPAAYEVGEEVRQLFCQKDPRLARYFAPKDPNKPKEPNKWWLDLPSAAADLLTQLGVTQISFSGCCTYSEPERWFSYRREGITGRQASFIGILP